MQFKSRVVLVYSWVGICATAWLVAGSDAWASARSPRDVLTDKEPQQVTVELDRKFVEQELSDEANPKYLVIQDGHVVYRQPGPKTIRQALDEVSRPERTPGLERIQKLMEDRLLDRSKPFCILVSEYKNPMFTIEPNRLAAGQTYSPSRHMSDHVFERAVRQGVTHPSSEYRGVAMKLPGNNRLECRTPPVAPEVYFDITARPPGWQIRSRLRNLKLTEVQKQLAGLIDLKSARTEGVLDASEESPLSVGGAY